MSIHDELERIAARAPEVVVPPGTWRRAQRARRRERSLVVAVVVVLVALAGSVAWWPSRDDGVEPVRTRAEVGVPSRLWAVPARFSETDGSQDWASDEVTDDATVVGIGAAAWVASGQLPVVVDAEFGDYHLLDLPDFIGDQTGYVGGPAVALSPDGGRLAYAYAAGGSESETEPVTSGVRVVDLDTGAVREVPVAGEDGIDIRRVAWSPNGLWLAFRGLLKPWWPDRDDGTWENLDVTGPVVGRIAPDHDAPAVHVVRNDYGGLVIDDEGVVTYGAEQVRRWDGDDRDRVVAGSSTRLLTDLGTLADGSVLRLPSGSAEEPNRVCLIRQGEVRRRAVIRIDRSTGSSLTVAVDLMDPAHPTVRRPEPEWPAEHPWLHAPALWVLIGLAAAGLLLRSLRLRGRALPRTAQSRWLGDGERRTDP